MTRPEILDTAKKCVCGDREQDYGSPESNFKTIASMWNSYLYGAGLIENKSDEWKGITPHDVAAMLALLKIARIASGHAKSDNWIDLAGYAACGGEIESANKQEEEFNCPAPDDVSCKKCPRTISANQRRKECGR